MSGLDGSEKETPNVNVDINVDEQKNACKRKDKLTNLEAVEGLHNSVCAWGSQSLPYSET